jgi:phosphosulfolactate phosphohydrolase-like enzyme
MSGERVLVCGERDGLKPAGYDLGNAPGEFSAARVRGNILVMATTNGTPAILRSRPALKTVIASFLNLKAVVDALVNGGTDVRIICAGEKGGPSWPPFFIRTPLLGQPLWPTHMAALPRKSRIGAVIKAPFCSPFR